MSIGLRPLGDNSALTHLATGRLILDDGIPRHDPFSFTAAGEPWTVQSWLAAAGMALADRVGGAEGIQLAHAALTACLAVLAWRLTRPCSALVGRILVASVVMVIGNHAWTERPLLVALVLLAALIIIVEEEGSPWVAGGLMWVWVNVHGTFPLALVYLGVRLVGRRIDGRPLGRLPSLCGAAAAGVLAGAISPLGPRLLIAPIELLGRHELLQRVREWRSPDFSSPENLLVLGGVLLALHTAGRRRSAEDGLTVAVFGAAACLAVRNLAPATLVLVPVLARALNGLGAVRGERRGVVTGAAAALLAVVAGAVTVAALRGPAYDLDRYPVEHLDWMEERGLLDERVATQDFVGNLIVARRGARANVFFDDRFDLYPRQVIDDALALLDGKEGWQDRLERYGIEAVLWQRSRPLSVLVGSDRGWRVVRRDEGWVLAVRQDSDKATVRRVLRETPTTD